MGEGMELPLLRLFLALQEGFLEEEEDFMTGSVVELGEEQVPPSCTS
jgi:hypothetical protein